MKRKKNFFLKIKFKKKKKKQKFLKKKKKNGTPTDDRFLGIGGTKVATT